jgi:hypothetical protein
VIVDTPINLIAGHDYALMAEVLGVRSSPLSPVGLSFMAQSFVLPTQLPTSLSMMRLCVPVLCLTVMGT